MFNVGMLRDAINDFAASIEFERDLIATTRQPLYDDWRRLRYIWQNTAHEPWVKLGWVRLLNAEAGVKEIGRHCGIAIRQLGEYAVKL